MRTSVGRTRVVGLSSGLQCAGDERRAQCLWPAGEGMAGGLILGYQKSAPSHSLSGDKWRCLNTNQERPISVPPQARAKQSAATLPAVEAGLSSAAGCGKRAGDCLSEASSSQPPQTASSARNRVAALPSARLLFAHFLLAKQEKVSRPPGRDPACLRHTASHAFQPTPQRN